MSSFFLPRPGRLAANAFEASIENQILRADDLYDLDGETFLRGRDGRVETASFDAFEQEAF
jgi:hypothetical protein